MTNSSGHESLFHLSTKSAATGVATGVRREVKFALTHADLGKLRTILEVNCRRVIYNRVRSIVYSIYFDDCRLSACGESLDGVSKRSKVRLRWYDDGDRVLFFERKRRLGLVIEKSRIAIESDAPLGSMSYRRISSELGRVLPAEHEEILRARSEPVLMTRYEREHFVALDSPVRITLDNEIVCYDQTSRNRLNKKFGVTIPNFSVLEGKAPPEYEMDLRYLLHPLDPPVTKSSKYVLGCQHLGLLTAGY